MKEDVKVRRVTAEYGRMLVTLWCKYRTQGRAKPYHELIYWLEGVPRVWVAMDNTDNECWVEEFSTEKEAIAWLKGEDNADN